MKKPYRDGVTLQDIIAAGWARDFQILQTYSEAHTMGFDVDIEYIYIVWERMEEIYKLQQSDNINDHILAKAKRLDLWSKE